VPNIDGGFANGSENCKIRFNGNSRFERLAFIAADQHSPGVRDAASAGR
jgi:hypothetical protein